MSWLLKTLLEVLVSNSRWDCSYSRVSIPVSGLGCIVFTQILQVIRLTEAGYDLPGWVMG